MCTIISMRSLIDFLSSRSVGAEWKYGFVHLQSRVKCQYKRSPGIALTRVLEPEAYYLVARLGIDIVRIGLLMPNPGVPQGSNPSVLTVRNLPGPGDRNFGKTKLTSLAGVAHLSSLRLNGGGPIVRSIRSPLRQTAFMGLSSSWASGIHKPEPHSWSRSYDAPSFTTCGICH
jgi:hypothetical protein